MDNYIDYLVTLWASLPYLFYVFVFLTLVPKSFRRILDFAETNYETNRYKYHRCYGPHICCHSYDPDLLPKRKQRSRAVTRVYPKKQNQMQSLSKACDEEESNQHLRKEYSTKTITTTAMELSSGGCKKQFHTNTNVNKIAKMFESGCVEKKINRVTPTTILTTPTLRNSLKSNNATTASPTTLIDSDRDKVYYTLCKQNAHILNSVNQNDKKYDKPLQQMPLKNNRKENLTNNFLQQQELSSELTDNWCSESVINTIVPNRPHQIPTSLTFAPTSSSTNSPKRSFSPIDDDNHALLDDFHSMSSSLNIQTSLEDIFAAIARNAEKNDNFFHIENTSDNPLSFPVTSIDDILSQRRLSRPLSAYSISDLLNDDLTTNAIHIATNNDNNGTVDSIT